MGKRIRQKEYAISSGNSSHHTNPGRVWGILHVIKYHHWRHVKRRLTQRKHCCGRHDPVANDIPETSDDSVAGNMLVNYNPNTTISDAEEKLVHSTPPAKHTFKSRIKSLLNEDIYKKKGSRHKRSSTCPSKSALNPADDSTHHLEVVDPISELLLSVESPEPDLETFENHLAAGTLDVLSPMSNNEQCLDCGTLFSSDILEQNHIHKHNKKYTNSKSLISLNQGMPEETLMNAKILTTDASPHLFNDFLDALDVINTNKDFLWRYIQDPGSPLTFRIHDTQSFKGKSRRANSISFPVSGSSSGIKDSESGESGKLLNQIVDEWINEKEEIQSQNHDDIQNVPISESSGDLHQKPLLPSGIFPPLVKTNHFKDLRKKIRHIIEESKNEKNRITMDAILDRIPSGSKLTKNVKKLIQSKDPTIHGEGKENATNGSGSRLSSFSFNKRQPSTMRTSSLKDSVGRYSQLYETCFNTEAKYPKTENLKLKAEEKNEKSSIVKTPKSFKRFLSLPNLKSYFHRSSEETSAHLSPQNSMKNYGDRIPSTSFIDADNNNKVQEISLHADQKQLLVRSASKSGLGIGVDGLGNLIEIDYGSFNEQHTGHETESVLTEANSVFSSDTSFLDVTFDLESLNALGESDSESKPGPVDEGLDNISDQEAKVDDHPEVVENGEKFQKLRTLSKRFNYETPIKVDANNEAAFNYVRKVLELSGFIGPESLGTWYSDEQPLDPSVYEELEGCLLLDPDCSGNCDENGQCNHLLLFDIINEGLLEIFGRSYSYYPRPLSSLSHVHPLPSGESVLYKVWTLISWYLNSTSNELYPSLDYYVSKDLAKNDGWMNLQFDSECVGLELDDLIFDDLLEEIMFT